MGCRIRASEGQAPSSPCFLSRSLPGVNQSGGSFDMSKYVCSVCGYVHEGDQPPKECPQCKAPGSKFVEQGPEMSWAAEHVVGVAQGAPEDIMEDLRANFNGECSEVGMYLCHGPHRPPRGLSRDRPVLGEGRLRGGRARRQVRRAAGHRGRVTEGHHQEEPGRWRVDCRVRRHRRQGRAGQAAPRSTTWTPSTTPSTRWPATRPATARPSRAC